MRSGTVKVKGQTVRGGAFGEPRLWERGGWVGILRLWVSPGMVSHRVVTGGNHVIRAVSTPDSHVGEVGRRLVVSGVDTALMTWSGKPADAMGDQASFPTRRARAG